MNPSLSKLLQLACNTDNAKSCFAIDVGAHHGEFSKFLMQTGLFGKVLAFEPNLESYLATQSAVPSQDNCVVEVINSALSSASGMLDLHCDADTATASLLQYDSSYLISGKIKRHTVSVLTLDEYLGANSDLGRLQCLKIDTQGNDLSVIKGGECAISVHRPIIQTEFIYIPLYEGQCSPAELTEALVHLDYKMYSLNNLHVTPEGRLAFCDAVFIPKELDIPVTQKFICIDDQISYQTQINILTEICEDRLNVINVLDAEVQRLNKILNGSHKPNSEKV
ncbi:FkbM family methyltransferase [Methylomonas rapida]|uniref:FkbM family methyltransferase n=1 Tax=Methylomonas rapida TaxID=2963939 RepID=A0ABY7GQ16_9GAMM|nr:FkbM family methyltransferase [Methylomonas rapida]WAR46600.1 FkbM family methyltransferase [Methylomonas rapida]